VRGAVTKSQFAIGASAVIALAVLQWSMPAPAPVPVTAAARLAVAVAAVVFVPGWAIMRALGWFSGATTIERWPLGFGIGFALVAILQIVAALFHLSIAQAASLLWITALVAAVAAPRPVGRPAEPWSLLAIVCVVCFSLCGWFLEPAITGEETVELISIRKLAENPSISIDGIMPEPGAIPTYVITPYYLFVALITKASGLTMFAAYLKLRALYAPLSVLAVAALAARLFGGKARIVDAVMVGVLVIFAVDPDPWSWPASLVPLVRRGGVSAGVIAPIMMLALLLYAQRDRVAGRAEALVPSLLLLALLTTHAMEIIYVGFFGAALLMAAGRSPRLSWIRIAEFGAVAAVTAAAYRAVHSRWASHVYEFDRANREQVLATLKGEWAAGWPSLSGISAAGKYLIADSGAVLPLALLGLAAAPLLARIDSAGGTVIWLATALPLAVYASSKLFALLQLATSSEVLFVFAYFTFLAMIALLVSVSWMAERLIAVIQSRTQGRSTAGLAAGAGAVFAVAGGWSLAAVWKVAVGLVMAHPMWLVWWTLVIGAAAQWRGGATWPGAIRPQAIAVAAVFLAGLSIGVRGTGYIEGSVRPHLIGALSRQSTVPSVLDWPRYYPVLQRQANPAIDLPAEVVEDLTRLLPPQQIIAADPAHSFSLPVMLNQHIVNPGHVISTSLRYFNDYAPVDAQGRRQHPLFNDSPDMTPKDFQFLEEYRVQYVIVNPAHRLRLGDKLEGLRDRFERIYDRQGFAVFRVREPQGVTG
jgi:hypothetical protein